VGLSDATLDGSSSSTSRSPARTARSTSTRWAEIDVSVGRTQHISMLEWLSTMSALTAHHPSVQAMQVMLELMLFLVFALPLLMSLMARHSWSRQA
jgi:hypothetical protein